MDWSKFDGLLNLLPFFFFLSCYETVNFTLPISSEVYYCNLVIIFLWDVSEKIIHGFHKVPLML